MTARVLIVDDERAMVDLLSEFLQAEGYTVLRATSGEEAVALLGANIVDVVLTDLRMRGMSGLDLASWLTANHPDVPVIVLTGFGSMATAVQALRAGVYDFLSKPVELTQVEIAVGRAARHRRLTQEVQELRRSVRAARPGAIVGESPAMRTLFELLPRAAQADVPVLITGETGTGKELVARALHEGSPRAKAPFVAVNCAALPDHLLESELFGHVRGAFTDARHDRRGLFVEAGEGTLLLDEVGEIPLALQPKLLRALQERRIRPLGADREVPIACRVIAATNRDLRAASEAGRFRGDLYYRLAVVRLHLPALRERAGDILLLAQHFLEVAAQRAGRRVGGLSAPVAQALLAYSWPGNVRELQNCMEGALALTRHDPIVLADLPPEVRGDGRAPEPNATPGGEPLTLAEVERRHILAVLDAVGGNKQDAARLLGIDRRTLYRKLDRFDDEG
jgi:two-component system response regulator AtoC